MCIVFSPFLLTQYSCDLLMFRKYLQLSINPSHTLIQQPPNNKDLNSFRKFNEICRGEEKKNTAKEDEDRIELKWEIAATEQIRSFNRISTYVFLIFFTHFQLLISQILTMISFPTIFLIAFHILVKVQDRGYRAKTHV